MKNDEIGLENFCSKRREMIKRLAAGETLTLCWHGQAVATVTPIARGLDVLESRAKAGLGTVDILKTKFKT